MLRSRPVAALARRAALVRAAPAARRAVPARAAPAARRFASVPPPVPKPAAGAGAPPPPPAPLRKPKLDLRPAPVKPPPPGPARAPPPPVIPAVPAPPPRGNLIEQAAANRSDEERHGVFPPPPPGAGTVRRLAHQAWQLLKFYYNGIRLVNVHRRRVAAVRARIAAGGPPMTRAEYRLARTYATDIKKLVPFLFIVVVLEEVIPFIALYAPFMLPSTCILPSQRITIDNKKTERARTTAARLAPALAALQHADTLPPAAITSGDVPELLCALMRLPTLGPHVLRVARLRRHLAHLAQDDALLAGEGALATLSEPELREALVERGFLDPGLTQLDQQRRLAWWLESVAAQDDPATGRAIVAARALRT